MRIILIAVFCVIFLILPVSAATLEAPAVPDSGQPFMPRNHQSFGEGILEILQDALPLVRPDLAEAGKVCSSIIALTVMMSVLQTYSDSVSSIAELTGLITIISLLIGSTHSMIQMGIRVISELAEYEKLLLPVSAAAIAVQGGVTSATALYIGTSFFNTLMGSFFRDYLLPLIYLFLGLAAANYASGESYLGKIKDSYKNMVHWILKTLLTVFTAYMSITGVVSGTTDAAALKAARTTISTFVPVVGGILSDASEAVLVSAGLIKNSIGIYGIYAILAIYVNPFIQIGIHYLMIKYTAIVCGIFGSKKIAGMIDDFSTAMSLILAITGAMCLMMLISSICFLKGMG